MIADNPLPFLSYDIYVTADGYYDASFLNVPIFQGIASLQNAYLIPENPMEQISSTLVRTRISQGMLISGLVPTEVEKYIIQYKFYQ